MLKDISWQQTGRVIVVTLEGLLTLDDVQQMKARANAMVDADGQPPMVHIIVDASQRGEFAKDLRNVRNFRDVMRQANDDEALAGWSIVVDSNPDIIMRFVVNTVMQVLGRRFRVYTNMDEALDFLHMVDQTLDFDPNASESNRPPALK